MKKISVVLALLFVTCVATTSFAYSKIVFNGVDDIGAKSDNGNSGGGDDNGNGNGGNKGDKGNNGNHYGQYKNGNNGNHYGWDQGTGNPHGSN